MKIIYGLILFCSFSALTKEKIDPIEQKIANNYAIAGGSVNFAQSLFFEVNKICKTNFIIEPRIMAEIDYLFRTKTDYRYIEFIEFLENLDYLTDLEQQLETKNLAENTAKNIIDQLGYCSKKALYKWSKTFISETIDVSLDTLRTETYLFGLPEIVRSEIEIENKFNDKIKNYEQLPGDEILSLSYALNTGYYYYSLLSRTKNIQVNVIKAAELTRYVAEKHNNISAYFLLGKIEEKYDKELALKSFKKSAELGFKKGEIWLGTYFACNYNEDKSLYWLNKAKLKDQTYVEDILAEIDELGIPTDCYEGWVY